MRQLNTNNTRASLQPGFTLIEFMVVVTIIASLATLAIPGLVSFLANSRLREGANTLQSTAALARSEAIKLNSSVSLNVSGKTITVVKESTSAILRTVLLPEGVQAASTKTIFNSAGQVFPFGTVLAIGLSMSSKACSSDLRCPAVLIDAGGSASVCARGSSQGVCS